MPDLGGEEPYQRGFQDVGRSRWVQTTVADLLAGRMDEGVEGGDEPIAWEIRPEGPVGLAASVEGQQFVNTQFCRQCRRIEAIRLCLAGRIPIQRRRCPACGQPMVVRGFDLRERIDASSFTSENLARPLADYGVVAGDVLSIRGAGEDRHFVLGGVRRREPPAAPTPDDPPGRSETEESRG